MRNIGGSFGIATMTTFLARRNQVHQSQLISHISTFDPRMRIMWRGMQGWFQIHGSSSVDAGRKALGAIYGMVQRQAAMLSFVEAFWVLGVIFLCMAPLLFLLRNPRKLHPHTPKHVPKEVPPVEVPAEPEAEPEPELVGALD